MRRICRHFVVKGAAHASVRDLFVLRPCEREQVCVEVGVDSPRLNGLSDTLGRARICSG